MAGVKGRSGSGGARENAGRKSKAEELGLRGKLEPMEKKFLTALEKGIEDGHPVALKLYADYMYGKPTDKIDVTSGGKALENVKHEIVFKEYTENAKL